VFDKIKFLSSKSCKYRLQIIIPPPFQQSKIISILGWRNLKKIENRNFEHFGALRALARRKMSPNYMSIEIRTPDFVPEFFFLGTQEFFKKSGVDFFWDYKIFDRRKFENFG